MSFDRLSTELLNRFPGLREEYAKTAELSGGDAPGQHIVFGDVLTPHVIRLLESGIANVELETLFGFLEELLQRGDERVTEVVVASVLERLNDRATWRNASRPFMGRKTAEYAERVERDWGTSG